MRLKFKLSTTRFYARFMAIVALAVGVGCSSENTQKQTNSINQVSLVSDSTFQVVVNLGNTRNATELIYLAQSLGGSYSVKALNILGSFKDSSLVPELFEFLINPDANVRNAAAWSIGQNGTANNFEALKTAYRNEQNKLVRITMLEAMGKIGDDNTTNFLAQEVQLNPDSLTAIGVAKACFQLQLNRKANNLTTKTVIYTLSNHLGESMLYCANYLSRTNDIFTSYLPVIQRKMDSTYNAPTLYYLTLSLKKISDLRKLQTIEKYINHQDPLIQLAAVRACTDAQILTEALKTALFNHLSNPNHAVGVAAAEIIASSAAFWPQEFQRKTHQNSDAEISSILMKGVWEFVDQKEITFESFYNNQTDDYSKIFALRSLAKFSAAYPVLKSICTEATNPILLTEAITAAFEASENNPQKIKEIAAIAFAKEDRVCKALACEKLAENDVPIAIAKAYKNEIEQTLSLLEMPTEIELYQSVAKAMDRIGSSYTKVIISAENYKQINWQLFNNKAVTQVQISTEVGDIMLNLYNEFAPASCSNFIELAQSGFFNDKFFHRVIGGFVAQGGCPRGDGWGSSYPMIRSEFSILPFSRGALGMASAGPDTESCQFFINLQHTPHLEGRYTVFGQVSDGFDTLDKIKIGTKIISISVL